MKKPFFRSVFFREKNKEVSAFQNNTENNNLNNFDLVDYSDVAFASTLLNQNSDEPVRTRNEIFKNWRDMEKNPIVGSALRLNTIAALGGHESKGELIFIEADANAKEEDKELIKELQEDLSPMFNSIAFSVAYNAIAFGDGYARTYFKPKEGLVHCFVDETLHPILVTPYEQGGITVGYVVGSSNGTPFRLDRTQMARMKMPRVSLIPQQGVFNKLQRTNLQENDIEKLPIIPSLIGGSFLYQAEKPFKDFSTTLSAIVGQRWVDAMDESIITVNMNGSSPEQVNRFKESIVKVLEKSKKMADQATKGIPQFQRVRHLLFTTNEKQITTQGEGLGSRRQGSVSIEDVLLHARLLSGSFGVDLSMIGFADQLSGGLGEGGFFRTSAQIAENSRIIRVSLSKFFEDIIDNHMLFKYGKKFGKGKPFSVNFYGSISAFESEKQRTRLDAVNSAGLITSTLAQLKELNLGENEMVLFMTKEMMLDQSEAELYAKSVIESRQQEIM